MSRFLSRFLGFVLGFLLVYCWWMEPGQLRLTEFEVSDPEEPLQTSIRVLLLTDWHLGRFSRPAVLKAKMEQMRKQHGITPFDLVLLGGDYVDIEPRYLPLLSPSLDILKGFNIPVVGVLGNHDFTSFDAAIDTVQTYLEDAGVSVLRNEAKALTVRGQRLLIVGVNDLQEAAEYYNPACYQPPTHYKEAATKMDWYCQFDSVEPDTPRLLLSHNPDAVYLPGRKPLAVLCGHTHGGQIMLLDWISRPLHRWLHPHLPPGSAVTWAGRRTVQDRTLIVSRGMEGSAVPVRLFRSPEAIIVSLR